MTIEDVIKELPFDASNILKYQTKEEYLNAYEKHLSIIAVKAELAGDDVLTKTIDELRELIKRIDNLSLEDSKRMAEKLKIISRYINKLKPDAEQEEQSLKNDILSTIAGMDELFEKYKQDYIREATAAKKFESKYRTLYGKPSGLMDEEFYTSDTYWFENEDEDDE